MASGSPVVALSVVDPDTSAVLVVVRDPEVNFTHPNVVSVPTQRIPYALHAELVELETACAADVVDAAQVLGSTHATRYVVDALLCRKLGVADALERGGLRYTPTGGVRLVGAADYRPFGVEPIDMINVVVTVDAGVELFPKRTSSYSTLRWVPPAELAAAVSSKDPLLVIPDGDPLELCIHGLCVRSTVAAAENGLIG